MRPKGRKGRVVDAGTAGRHDDHLELGCNALTCQIADDLQPLPRIPERDGVDRKRRLVAVHDAQSSRTVRGHAPS